MYWLADVLVGSRVDYRPFIERARVQRSKAFHRIAGAAVRRFRNTPRTIRSLFARYRQWRKQRARMDALRGLSDHTLKDIGLTRGDIRGIATVLAGRDHGLSVPEYCNRFVDQRDHGEKISAREVVKETRDESQLPRAA